MQLLKSALMIADQFASTVTCGGDTAHAQPLSLDFKHTDSAVT